MQSAAEPCELKFGGSLSGLATPGSALKRDPLSCRYPFALELPRHQT
jgi:hypothetical protein